VPESSDAEPTFVGRAIWSGTITFGLVSIPVDLFSGERPRGTSMKMVDASGHPLGRRYFCPKDGKALNQDDLVRGFETRGGKLVVVTDAELEAIAPEKSRDIDLRQFVPLEQIPQAFFDQPYYLIPAGRSSKAYHLLTLTMERAGRAGIATFVMREKEYLVAIVAENGVLRAETLRFANELRTPDEVGLPPLKKPTPARVKKFAAAIKRLTRKAIDPQEMTDTYAHDIRALAEKKLKKKQDVVAMPESEGENGEATAEVIDLMQVIKERLARNATVTSALDEKASRKRRGEGAEARRARARA
jgi:DNA end-binding protein Ku